MQRILVLDDDRQTCVFIEELLAQPDREFVSVLDPDEAIARLEREPFDLLISDINLNAARTGLDVLRAFKRAHPAGQVLLISGFGTLETAIEAVRAGAFDYISKPFDIGQVKATVARALEQAARAATGHDPAPAVAAPQGLIGRTAPMLEVYKQIARATDSAAPVLIVGESGTGKELVARAIHAHGPRAREPFVAVNCGAIAESLLESELFGHMRGAFTGAVADTKGLFEQAGRGTVFLDEIAETSPALQVKLLRVLEEGEVRPVGGGRTVPVHARVIAATNADLDGAVAAGRFRQDLYFRLSVIVIRVPPLRDRRPDIPLLISAFLDAASARAGRRVTLSAEALDALMRYPWPGNVRELENTIERLVLFAPGAVIEAADLPGPIREAAPSLEERLFAGLPTLDELERRYLAHVLQAVGRNRTRAAEVLGIDRGTLYRMARRYGLDLKHER
ncbi:MAG TPA: sigma-54 dependent transcriptional regulator [Vicinamibacterales bacterium]|nr:sigma-54 dependent transcriptional regulator [Vicinamibacterales bacterium]